MLIFIKGIVVGFIIALPVGPIAILCVQRTLTKGRRHGFVSGIGAATADSGYGAIVALGLTYTSQFINQNQLIIHWLGGIALCLVGIRTYMAKVRKQRPMNPHIDHAGNFLSTLIITAMNPMTIITFMLVFPHIGLTESTPFAAALLVLGTFIGSSIWWLTICLIAGQLRTFIAHGHLRLINRIAGLVIFLFGLFVIVSQCFR